MSSPPTVSGDQSARGESHAPPQDGSALLEREIPPLVRRAQAAFRRDLPQLLEDHRHQWVAYHGDRRVALGHTKRELYQRCLRHGFPPDEFVVRCIEPEPPEDLDWEEFRNV
jgi:hypothetical protein